MRRHGLGRLAWAGVVEALAAAGVGLWLQHALPSRDRAWTWGLWAAGFLVLVLSLALSLGGRRESAAADPDPRGAELPVVPPPSAVAAYPRELADMWRDVIQAHLDVGALRAAVSQAAAARAVLDGGGAAHATALFEAHVLREGYRQWALGREARPDLDAYREVVDPAAARERQAALAAERDRLAAEWASWHGGQEPEAASPSERLPGAEAREQQLAAMLRRAEELALLLPGYEALAPSGGVPEAQEEGD